MTTNPAKYTFISYMREGIGAQYETLTSTELEEVKDLLGEDIVLPDPPPDPAPLPRTNAKVDVRISLTGKDPGNNDGSPTTDNIIQQYKVTGPGEIMGINNRVMVRTSPMPGESDFSPNFLAFIDFYSEDFPWRFTPLAAAVKSTETDSDALRKLRPWITLVVLAENEFTFLQPESALPQAFVLKENININNVFPSEKDVWAWAHVQINEEIVGISKEEELNKFKDIISQTPDRAVSRIICPRKLKINTKYHAFLIPTFLRGRMAGLGDSIENLALIDAQIPAWNENISNREFPYYLHWEFSTGSYTDFESLVNNIKPSDPEKGIGKINLDLRNLNYPALEEWMNDPNTTFDGILEMDGLLKAPFISDPVPSEVKEKYRELINLGDDNKSNSNLIDPYTGDNQPNDPVLTIPFYGQWYAAKTRADATEDAYWLNTINLDPRYRLTVGLGSEIVRKNADKLKSDAWSQSVAQDDEEEDFYFPQGGGGTRWGKGGGLLNLNKKLRLLQHSE